MRIDLTPRQVELFWQKVDRSGGPDACWPWTACLGTGGYGKFGISGQRTEGAHRIAYVLTHGEIPDDLPCILHRCDHRPCTNPAHLFAGTKRENTRDMYAKGRACQQTGTWKPKQGSTNANAKLTETDVIAIRARIAAGESAQDLAPQYNVTKGVIFHIKHNRSWKHV